MKGRSSVWSHRTPVTSVVDEWAVTPYRDLRNLSRGSGGLKGRDGEQAG